VSRVRSLAGRISHSPDEHTDPQAIAKVKGMGSFPVRAYAMLG
jgi:hypothetical protein